jgi:NitT/TauT family transport system ATP-binding protein
VSEAALELDELTVRFSHDGVDVTAVDHVSLTVPRGQFLVLIGPSGQGKSTLLKAAAGLLAPTSGQILAHGALVSGPSRERGLVFQQDTTFPWLRVRDNIAYGLAAQGVRGAERELRVAEHLEAVGLSEFAASWPKQLSGGMRKRVAIATAFASDPQILLMDEPFGSLDFVTRTRLHLLLLDLWQQTGKTIVFVTHDVDETLLLADRVVVLTHGKVADDLPVDFLRPRTDELRANPAAIGLRRHLLSRLGLEYDAVVAGA